MQFVGLSVLQQGGGGGETCDISAITSIDGVFQSHFTFKKKAFLGGVKDEELL